MSLEANKALVRRYFEDTSRDPDVCDEIYADHFQFHTIQHVSDGPQVVPSTPESEKEALQWLRSVWGDWQITIDEMLAEDNRVMVRWTFHGTHQGELFDLPPTHKPVSYAGINIFRIADGKIAEIWDITDSLWLWQQLGVLPSLIEAIERAREAMLSQGGRRTA